MSVRTRIRQSLLRPLLIFGCERELVIASGILAAMLVFSVGSLVLAAVGIAFWLAALAAFQRMAKYDPQMLRVYIRHANRKTYYPARAHVCAFDPIVKKHQ